MQLKCTKLTKEQYDELIKDLRGKIFVLLMNIEALLPGNGQLYETGFAVLKETRYNLGIASLYTHAIEQLGKLILVKSCKLVGKYYNLEPIKSDFYNHDKKIKTALNVLPKQCKDIFVKNSKNASIDLDLRLELLHSDIDANGNVIIADAMDVDKIKQAITWFKTEQYAY